MQDASDIIVDHDIETPTLASVENRVSAFVSDSADKVVRTAREHPKTAIAAGAAVVVGAIAAAAIPALRASKSKTPSRKAPAVKRPATRKSAPSKSTAAKKTS